MLIGICGDWPLWRESLLREIKSYLALLETNSKVVYFCSDVDLLKSKLVYDIIFLDLNLNTDYNIYSEIVKKLSTKNSLIKIVLILSSEINTSIFYNNYIHSCIRNDAVKNIINHINKFIYEYKNKLIKDFYFKNLDNGVDISIKISQIIMLESIKNGCYIYTKNEVFRTSKTFNKCLIDLSDTEICQTHRRFAVNLNYINKIDDNIVSVENYKAEISCRMKKDLIKKYTENSLEN